MPIARRILLLCGVVSPILYGIADMAAGLSFEGYSFRDQTISELGATGAPSAAIFSALLIPTYVLLVLFGIGILKSAGSRNRLSIAGGLLVVYGVIALTVGPFVAMRPRGIDQELAGVLHLAEGAVEMFILLLAMALASLSLGRSFAIYTIVTIALMFIFAVWSLLEMPQIEAGLSTPWIGVKERIYWYAYQLWFIGLAIVLLNQATSESARH